jgi:redox-sensitive bicupin YhaK (pirin superfamily)
MNEDRIKPGKGYPAENRRDTEVLSYLIEGELRHQDSLGNDLSLRAGGLQLLSTGTGMRHAESNPSATREAHLLHICIEPATAGLTPSYEQKHFSSDEKRGALRLLASPDGANGSVTIHQDTRIYGGLFHEAERAELELPATRRAFIHVVRGSIALNETRLNAGDGVKINDHSAVVLQHGREAHVIVFDVPAGPPPVKRKSTLKT